MPRTVSERSRRSQTMHHENQLKSTSSANHSLNSEPASSAKSETHEDCELNSNGHDHAATSTENPQACNEHRTQKKKGTYLMNKKPRSAKKCLVKGMVEDIKAGNGTSECINQSNETNNCEKIFESALPKDLEVAVNGATELPVNDLDMHENGNVVSDTANENDTDVHCLPNSEPVDLKPNVSTLKSSHGRLSLKGRKEDAVAPIFKQICLSKPVDKMRSNGLLKDNGQEVSELMPMAAAPALVNLGNTCFLNSIVQVLYYTPSFSESIAVLAAEIAATTRDNDILATLDLMKKADERFAAGCTETMAISPTAVLNQLETMNSLFSGGHQQDAHELLRCVLSYVQDSIKILNTYRSSLSAAIKSNPEKEIKRGGNMPTTSTRNSNGSNTSDKTSKKTKRQRSNSLESESAAEGGGATSVHRITEFFARAEPKPKSLSDVSVRTKSLIDFVEDTCGGVAERRTRCLECEKITTCTELFQDVGVVVQKGGALKNESESDYDTDHECCWIVKSLEEIERLQGDNKYWCSECDHHVEAERSVEFHRVPEILTIQMKRFSAFSTGFFGSFTKTMDCVNVPFEMQCLEKQCRQSSNGTTHRYNLFAILCHTGMSLSSGHYVAYVKSESIAKVIEQGLKSNDDTTNEHSKVVSNADSNQGPWWYVCDDDSISAICQSELKQKLSAGGASTPYLLFYRRSVIVKE